MSDFCKRIVYNESFLFYLKNILVILFFLVKVTSSNILVTTSDKNVKILLNSTSRQQVDLSLLSKPESLIATNQQDDYIQTTILSNNQDYINDGLCTLSTIAKRVTSSSEDQLSILTNVDVKRERVGQIYYERVLNCSKVDEFNYNKIIKNFNKRNKLNIQQIHIIDSESLVIFSAIDLICDCFDCSKLTTFNVTGHKIHDLNVLSSWINLWPQLEVLDLSNTFLSSIESIFNSKSNLILQNLKTLLLDSNEIKLLNFDFIFNRMPNLKYLSLINNTIIDINCQENLRLKVKTQFEQINLAGNSINCSKSQLWFMKQFQTNFKFPDYDKISCLLPEGLSDMTWPQRVSVLETKICELCDCKSLKRAAISVDCHNKGLSSLPDVLPLNTKVLNLTSNRINSLGLPQNSKNWENVTYVYLENNLITSFQPLDKNSKFMRNLAALDIRKNRFKEFPSHIFEQFINLDQVHLSNNPWLCDCESTFAFQEWLQRQFHKVGDKEEILCGISGSDENGVRSNNLQQRLSARVIYRLAKSELCPQNNEEEPYDWLDFVNIALGITILLILTKVTIDYIYQHRTKRLPHFFKLNY